MGQNVPGDVDFVRVEAIGEPGQRRFRLMVILGGGTTIAWMEKIQLNALGKALEQMLAQLPELEGPPAVLDSVDVFDTSTRDQFRVGRLEIGFDDESLAVVILAYDIESEETDEPRLFCRMTRNQAAAVSEEAERVVAAGRPRCVLCGLPMGSGPHACAQQNGHLIHEGEDIE